MKTKKKGDRKKDLKYVLLYIAIDEKFNRKKF